MSAFGKIAGMFPSRELGEKVAKEILDERDRENAQKIRNLIPGITGQMSSPRSREIYQAALTSAAATIEPDDLYSEMFQGPPDAENSLEIRPSKKDVADAEYVIAHDAPEDVLAKAYTILNAAATFGTRD